jgi:hypothetical protein
MKKVKYVILFIYAVLATLTIIYFNGTGDAGDSITHYLFARYAPVHPELFFDHWAKPVYVLLACPFAQFGFTGIKVFNAVGALFTIFFTYRTVQELMLKNAVLVVVIMIFTPLYYILTFSGLTEPLFALALAVCLYLAIKEKFLAASLVISFLPYIRSEGLIIIGVFAFWLLLKKQWKVLPFLFFGSFVYSIAGFFVYHDLLWVFSRIPYAQAGSPYGSGSLFHFTEQLFYVTGVPVYILFWLGIISIILRSFRKTITQEELILVAGGFLCFFVAHSLFWYFGIFNSMGLKRVLIAVMPLTAIISLQGFNFITDFISSDKMILKRTVQGILVIYIVIFPFTANPAAINWKKDMMLNKDQQCALEAVHFIADKKLTGSQILCAHPYVFMALNIDCFDNRERPGFSQNDIRQMKPGDIIIWENWFALVESNISNKALEEDSTLVNLYNSTVEEDGREILYSVYIRK